MAANGFTWDPLAWNEGGNRLGWDAHQSVVNHRYHEVDGSLADKVISLVHACPVGVVLAPLVLNESDIVWS